MQGSVPKTAPDVLQIRNTSSQPSPSAVKCCRWVPRVIIQGHAAKDEPLEKDPTSLSTSPCADIAPLLHWYRQAGASISVPNEDLALLRKGNN